MNSHKIPVVPFGEEGPFPAMTVKAAANKLGVSQELLRGLAIGKQIRAFPTYGRTGALMWMISVEEVRRLADQLAV